MNTKTPTLQEKVTMYEDVFHHINLCCTSGNNDKIRRLVSNIDAWSYAHRQGNGEPSEREQQKMINVKFWKLNDVDPNPIPNELPTSVKSEEKWELGDYAYFKFKNATVINLGFFTYDKAYKIIKISAENITIVDDFGNEKEYFNTFGYLRKANQIEIYNNKRFLD